MNKRFNLSTFCIVICLFFTLVLNAQSSKNNNGVTIHKIANCGVYITYQKQGLLIDGLFKKVYPNYEVPEAEVIEQIMERKPPFKQLKQVMVTHQHGDHYDVDLLNKAYNKKIADIILPVQLKQEAKGAYPDPILYQPTVYANKKITVTAFPMPHAGNFKDIQNICYLIDLGGFRVLHTGDANLSYLKEAALSWLFEEDIDLAIIPFFEVGNQLDYLLEEKRIKQLLPIHFDSRVPDIPGKLKATGLSNLIFFEGQVLKF